MKREVSMKKQISVDQAIDIIDRFVKEKYPNFYKHPEYKAAITHWLQNPNYQYPFITNELFNDLRKLFRIS